MIFDGRVGAPPKVLGIYMGETALPTDPTWNILGTLLWGVVVLSWQHNDQLKSRIPWMEIYINHWLPIKRRIPNACVGRFGDQAMSLEICGI